MKQTAHDAHLWSIVLAGGEGERLKPFVKRWLGRHKPKQYCSFIGTRSMFQHTLDRSDQIVMARRRVTVVARNHREDVLSQMASRDKGIVLFQPRNRDTAAGIFLGLAYVRSCDPEATVVIFPSDHFVYPEERFVEMTRTLARAASSLTHWVFLLGVPPQSPEQEYGWIRPGKSLGWIDGIRIQAAEAFVEKPRPEACRLAMNAGGMWNTMVVAARLDTLWQLGRQSFPELLRLFEVYGRSIQTKQENAILEKIYAAMPKRNFSSHLLQEFPKHVAVIELKGVVWSDWGQPERIVQTLYRMDRQPNFCLAHVGGSEHNGHPKATCQRTASESGIRTLMANPLINSQRLNSEVSCAGASPGPNH